MDVSQYRSFQEAAPDHERWELVGGLPVRVPPQTLRHARLASKLENALDACLRMRGARMMALQRIAVDVASTDGIERSLDIPGRCAPGPDVAVIDTGQARDAWLASRAYLLGEVVGDEHDDRPVGNGSWLDAKVACYMAHAPCAAILLVEQGRPEVRLHLRDGARWSTALLGEGDEIVVPALGVSVPVETLYGR